MEPRFHLILSGGARIDGRANSAPCVAAEQGISVAGGHRLGWLLLELKYQKMLPQIAQQSVEV